MPQFSNWLVTENDRTKALVKYEINALKSMLHKHLDAFNELYYCTDQIILICSSLASKYLDYLQLIDHRITVDFPKQAVALSHWPKHFKQIFTLELKLALTLTTSEKKEVLVEIILLYRRVKLDVSLDSIKVHEHAKQLKQVFCMQQLHLWLIGLVDFYNQPDVTRVELSAIFQNWNMQQQQSGLDFFSEPKFIDLVNAIFFYKLNPDKLFSDSLHPEKLISIRMRLGALHDYIELIQQQLYVVALQNGLMPGIDYFLHDEELPQGIKIEIDDEYKHTIQAAIKRLKVNSSPKNIQQMTLSCLNDLSRAYKFWFNPNRLIDTVMVLQQNLVSGEWELEQRKSIFQEKMIFLYSKLTTTQCLDLYGYFSNKDSRYLLYTFFAITQGKTFDWLPFLNDEEKASVIDVFDALCCVMEALRAELKNRHIITESYAYEMTNPSVQIRHRNRDAVLRAITIYHREKVIINDTVEQLFEYIGENL